MNIYLLFSINFKSRSPVLGTEGNSAKNLSFCSLYTSHLPFSRFNLKLLFFNIIVYAKEFFLDFH